jgi:hypothetical protein
MDYERGLEHIIQQARGTSWFNDCALYEARLRSNLDEERRYGITDQTRSNKAQIIEQLNCLAYEHLKVSFVDLCMGKNVDQHVEATYQPNLLREQSVSDILVQNAPIPQLIPEDVCQSSPAKVFVGYSHKDRSYQEDLRVHLAPYIRANKVACWDDEEINPGAVWREEIKTALQAANMAVLLVSPHFLASDFVVNHELPYLLASAKSGKMAILSVILRPCLFNDTDLAQFQAVNPPLRPVSGMNRSERDKVWIKVTECIKANL